jgi:hypothetical protein
MATVVTYTLVGRCEGGEHLNFDVSVNDSPPEQMVFNLTDIDMPLEELEQDRKNLLKMLVLNLHMAGATPSLLQADIGTQVTVTI